MTTLAEHKLNINYICRQNDIKITYCSLCEIVVKRYSALGKAVLIQVKPSATGSDRHYQKWIMLEELDKWDIVDTYED